MANGTGGVFLIGVQTVKSNKLDVADSLHPVENVEEHAQEIQSAIALYSSPQIENVEIEIIFTAKNNGYGYILIAVPLSNLRPHMATAAGENRYYRRGLDGTRMMDH